MKIFKPFWFDGNLYFGEINTTEDFEMLSKLYQDRGVSILEAQCVNEFDRDNPNFGFRSEHSGDITLGEWLQE